MKTCVSKNLYINRKIDDKNHLYISRWLNKAIVTRKWLKYENHWNNWDKL